MRLGERLLSAPREAEAAGKRSPPPAQRIFLGPRTGRLIQLGTFWIYNPPLLHPP